MRPGKTQFQFYITKEQQSQIERMKAAGFNTAAVIRLAIQKCSRIDLDIDDDIVRPVRLQIYLDQPDNVLLTDVAAQLGGCSKAAALRRLLSTYLRINAKAIDALF